MTFTKRFLFFLQSVISSGRGLGITWKHLFRSSFHSRKVHDIRQPDYFKDNHPGISVLTYPLEAIPVPEIGRYQLHNEIKDCIVCDKCAKICPVDCIEIEAIKSPAEFGKTTDGTSKRLYAAKFDIDMAKCCYCGLCTTVCPTECLTMSDEYDYSVFDLSKLKFGFGNLTEAEAEQKRKDWERHQAAKNMGVQKENNPASSRVRPSFMPSQPAGPAHKPTEQDSVVNQNNSNQQVEEEKKPDAEEYKPVRNRPVIGRPNIAQTQPEPAPSQEDPNKTKKPNRPIFNSPPKPNSTNES